MGGRFGGGDGARTGVEVVCGKEVKEEVKERKMFGGKAWKFGVHLERETSVQW